MARPGWRRAARWLWLAVPLAVGAVAFSHRDALVVALALVGRAQPGWLAAGAAAIAALYLSRAAVYRVPLRLLGYSVDLPYLWGTAVAATSMHQLLPAAGASGYTFLTYAMVQRGVSAGEASLVALIDTLSYAAALGSLVAAALIVLAAGGGLHGPGTSALFGAGLAVLGAGAWLYYQQRDARRLVPAVLRVKARVAAWLGRDWPDAPIRRFFDEYYRGKRIIRRRPRAFAGMLALQYLAIGFDAAALYAAFLALGRRPSPWLVVMGFVVAMAGVSIVGVPGGGGGFEAVMSAFFASHGIRASEGIAAALLYRLLAFWLPVTVTLVVLWRLRRRRRAITPTDPGRARRARARP